MAQDCEQASPQVCRRVQWKAELDAKRNELKQRPPSAINYNYFDSTHVPSMRMRFRREDWLL